MSAAAEAFAFALLAAGADGGRTRRDLGGGCGRGFRLGALGIHQTLEARGDIAVGVVEACQVAVDGSGLRRAAALLQLGSQGVQITQHGGIGLAALQLGEALFEVVEQSRGIRAHRSRDAGGRRRRGGGGETAPEQKGAAAGQ